MGKHNLSIQVNGRSYKREVDSRLTLVDLIRHELDLTGTHVGCEHGVCGACTVLINGRSARSCLTFAIQADGCDITTIEGLAEADGELNSLQRAFREHHGLQCGFCTPGVLISLTELLRDNPDPSEDQVRDVLTGNLCRCTGYAGMVTAALAAAREMRAQAGG